MAMPARNKDLPEEVLIAPPLRIRYAPGRSRRLVISLSGVGRERHEEPPIEFYRMARWGDENHVLFITDESRSWLNAPGMAEAIVKVIEETAARIDATDVIALGNSMGGTMALLLSKLTRLDRVIAFVPQWSVDPQIVPEETRWPYFRKRIEHFRFSEVGLLPTDRTQFTILHGSTEDELIHERRFSDQEEVAHYILPGADHKLAAALNAEQKLAQIVADAMLGRPWKVRRAVRAAGGMSRQAYRRRNAGGWAFGDEGEE